MEQNNLELGKYLESDLLSLTEESVDGGASPATPWLVKASVAVTAFISANTCPTTSCTRAC
ncbi:class II lanthipeptide, LchA2/BrtA2 family [Streptococcus equi]|uniref:Lantibiotic lacticin 3147 A2 n=1 Tax=Streptococcus equi subsp. zooepidemicus TaxID=40041 RepID=A0A7Z8ZVA0_STRSZ|nr:class II lanthipeptide, LchA2/BrtA2 family [Streptococcus equi]VEF05456.1 Lantibiotic lacticin 3147 A2 precursor [Streptococcus equi subsp. zooepidemicus]